MKKLAQLPWSFLLCVPTLLFSGTLAYAAAAGIDVSSVNEEPLPVVSADFFEPGKEWAWDYFKVSGEPYSTEHYRVVERQGDRIVFEMRSSYHATENRPSWKGPHHRLIADVGRCLKAHRNPADPKPWSVQLLYWDEKQGLWVDSGMQPPLAFEEKFNCDPHTRATPYRHAVRTEKRQGLEAFHAKAKNGRDRSWYERSGDNAGVALEKEFHQNGRLTYRFVKRGL